MLAMLCERRAPAWMAAIARAEVVPLMPVIREPLSVSTLADMLGVEPWRLIAVEVNLLTEKANLVLHPEEDRELRTGKAA